MIHSDLAAGLAPWERRAGPHTRGASPVLIVLMTATAILFLASAAAFIAPSLPHVGSGAGRAEPLRSSTTTATTGAPLTDVERSLVLSYVETLRPDDPLVEVRPGVQTKRSNVEGVHLEDRTVYYDIVGHQSFGPLASGRVGERDVDILSREGAPPFVVLVYARKR
jgi:hypothetical protein